jgi:hypothetical protein
MGTVTLVKTFLEIPAVPTYNGVPIEMQADKTDAARSENNILQWMAYLPEDCVRTMIANGWDVST